MSKARRLAALGLLGLMLSALAPVGAPATGSAPAPTSLEPLSFSLPFVYRTMEGLQTNLVSPMPTYDHLHDVAWAPDGHMALAVGSHNTLVSFDPAGPSARVLRNGTLGNLYGVAWSDDSQMALAVGWNGALVSYTASGITDLPSQGVVEWHSAAFVPGSGFLVVGLAGQMFFLNGTTRTPVNSPTTSDLLGVSYSAVLGRALAVGRAGTAVEITPAGVATLVASPVTDDLRSVGFESDTGKGLVAGGAGTLLSYQGGALANESHNVTDGGYYDISVSSSAEPAVVAIRNGSAGSVLFTNASYSNWISGRVSLGGVEAVARAPTQGYVIATGFFGEFVLASQNGTLTNLSNPYRPTLTDASWRAQGDLALLVGFNSTVLLYNRTANATSAVSVPTINASLRGVSWAPNGSEAILIGGATFWRYDAASGNISQPIGATALDLYGVAFRPGGAEAVVVGSAGYLGLWDGSSLTRISSTSITQGLFTVRWHLDAGGSGDYAYAAGANFVARFDMPNVVSTVTRIGTFFGVGFIGDDVWVVGNSHQIHRYDASNGIWDNLSLPSALSSVRFTRAVPLPSGEGLMLVGNQTFSGYLNLTRVMRFDTGFLADFNGVEFNPVTREPLFYGAFSLAFDMREGSFPNLPPSVILSSPANGTNWTTADTITFDASGSSDLDNDPITITWWDNITGYLTAAPSFATQLSAGQHTVTAFVDDGKGHNVSASVELFVAVAQYPPVPIIGSPLAASNYSDDDNITFSGATSYDPNPTDTLAYRWTLDSTEILANSSIVVAKLRAGTHVVTLNVTDQTGRSAEASVILVIHQGNAPPFPTVVSPQAGGSYASNIPIRFDSTGTFDNDSISLTYLWLVDGAEIGRLPIMNATQGAGSHIVTLQVSDGAKTSQIVIAIQVGGPVDLPPKFVSINPPNGTVLTGTVVFNGSVELDPQGPVRFIRYSIDGGNLETASGFLSWSAVIDTTLLMNGTINVTFQAIDDAHATSETRTYIVANPFVNVVPTVDFLTPSSGSYLRGSVTLAGSVSDPDTPVATVEYRLGQGPWRAAAIQGTSWSATLDTSGLADGPVIIELRAFDGYNYSSSSFVTVNVDNGPAPEAGVSLETLALAVLALAAVAGVAIVLLRRKRA
jgi:hypothetical protein